jgi:hypothetical protein
VLYIGGWGRSGSTLLDRMLASTFGFFAAGELREIWWRGCIENRSCGCGEPFGECPFWAKVGDEAFGGWATQDAGARAELRLGLDRPWHVPLLLGPGVLGGYRRRHDEYTAVLGDLYRAIADVSAAPVVVDSSKIPTYGMLLRRTPGIDLRILHLVRDPRGVVHSWRKEMSRQDTNATEPDQSRSDAMYRYGLTSATLRYDMYNMLTQTVARWRTPYLRIRYEDLVAQPVSTVERIGDFAWGTAMTDPGALAAGAVEFTTDHTVDGNPIRFQHGTVPLRLDDAWMTGLDRGTRRKVTALTAPLIAAYHYPFT